MDRPVFGKKSQCRLQRPRVDRFMVPRETVVNERRRRSRRLSLGDHTIDIWEAKHQKQKNYRNYLDEVFGLETTQCQEPRGPEEECCVQPWPCAPRRRGYLSSADSILDLPTYSFATFPELLDWSTGNMLVAALGSNYHMYSWVNQSVMGQGMTEFGIHCCKFNPKGDILLIGTHMGTVEVHDSESSKQVKSGRCRCFHSFKMCAITAVDWSPTGNSFISGCSRGWVIAYDSRSVAKFRWRRLTRSPILTVRISPDARYVAVVALNSPIVQVLVWHTLEHYSNLSSNWIVKTLAWHPWRSALLGIGAMSSALHTTIAMWDTPSSRLREGRLGSYNHYSLDVMLFSHRTGELVLSLWNSDRAATFPKTCSQLVVMSDPYTVVDQSGEGKSGLDRVRTMVFSPDGTKLATATADEDLIIWNFLPEDKKPRRSRRLYAIPVYLDQFTHGFTLR